MACDYECQHSAWGRCAFLMLCVLQGACIVHAGRCLAVAKQTKQAVLKSPTSHWLAVSMISAFCAIRGTEYAYVAFAPERLSVPTIRLLAIAPHPAQVGLLSGNIFLWWRVTRHNFAVETWTSGRVAFGAFNVTQVLAYGSCLALLGCSIADRWSDDLVSAIDSAANMLTCIVNVALQLGFLTLLRRFTRLFFSVAPPSPARSHDAAPAEPGSFPRSTSAPWGRRLSCVCASPPFWARTRTGRPRAVRTLILLGRIAVISASALAVNTAIQVAWSAVLLRFALRGEHVAAADRGWPFSVPVLAVHSAMEVVPCAALLYVLAQMLGGLSAPAGSTSAGLPARGRGEGGDDSCSGDGYITHETTNALVGVMRTGEGSAGDEGSFGSHAFGDSFMTRQSISGSHLGFQARKLSQGAEFELASTNSTTHASRSFDSSRPAPTARSTGQTPAS